MYDEDRVRITEGGMRQTYTIDSIDGPIISAGNRIYRVFDIMRFVGRLPDDTFKLVMKTAMNKRLDFVRFQPPHHDVMAYGTVYKAGDVIVHFYWTKMVIIGSMVEFINRILPAIADICVDNQILGWTYKRNALGYLNDEALVYNRPDNFGFEVTFSLKTMEGQLHYTSDQESFGQHPAFQLAVDFCVWLVAAGDIKIESQQDYLRVGIADGSIVWVSYYPSRGDIKSITLPRRLSNFYKARAKQAAENTKEKTNA